MKFILYICLNCIEYISSSSSSSYSHTLYAIHKNFVCITIQYTIKCNAHRGDINWMMMMWCVLQICNSFFSFFFLCCLTTIYCSFFSLCLTCIHSPSVSVSVGLHCNTISYLLLCVWIHCCCCYFVHRWLFFLYMVWCPYTMATEHNMHSTTNTHISIRICKEIDREYFSVSRISFTPQHS